MRPVSPAFKVSCPYGKEGEHWSAGYHTGVDYACPVGTQVLATFKGKVDRAGWDKAYGWYVRVMTPDAVAVYYCHLSKIQVKVGQRLKTGQAVGLSGNSGNSTGAHLHYEERVAPYRYTFDRKPEYNNARV